jgi:hypothetical protein
MEIQDFIEKIVDIEFIESAGCFGHYPFQLLAETKTGNIELNALFFGGDILACYSRVLHYVNHGYTKIFLSIDFPIGVGSDLQSDFVGVFSIIDGKLKSLAIPYNTANGTIFSQVTDSSYMKKVENDLFKIIKSALYAFLLLPDEHEN